MVGRSVIFLSISLILINASPMPKLFDAYNASFAALDGSLPQDFKTNSRDKEWLTGRVISSAVASNSESSGDEIFSIASVTKTFSAVAITKVVTSEEFAEYFDSEDPLGTKLSAFEELIEKHGSENEKYYISELKTAHQNYSDITLRHLLNHTAGIEDPSYYDDFRADQTRSFRFEDGKYFSPVVRSFGNHSYSNVGYEIAALMAKVVVSEERGTPVGFGEIIREQIIQPLQLHATFTSDEMACEENLVKVKDQNIRVAQSYDYYKGKLTTGQDFNDDVASGGVYSSAADVAKFYRAVASEEVFGENHQAAEKFFAAENFVLSGEPAGERYGLGIRKIADDKTEYLHHGGAGILFYSHAIAERKVGHPETAKSAATLLAYENLTRPIAARLLSNEKKDEKGRYFVDQELSKKMNWLAKTFSSEQLVYLRQILEFSPREFEEKYFEEFQKLPKPTASALPSHLEKMVSKTGSKFNEIY